MRKKYLQIIFFSKDEKSKYEKDANRIYLQGWRRGILDLNSIQIKKYINY